MPADSFESPLTLAACGGHVDLAMLLLERGANIEEVIYYFFLIFQDIFFSILPPIFFKLSGKEDENKDRLLIWGSSRTMKCKKNSNSKI